MSSFVIDALRPDHLIPGQKELERPAFAENEAAWTQVFGMASRWEGEAAVADAVWRTSWWGSLPESVRLQFDERLKRAKLQAAMLEEETRWALQQFVLDRIPAVVLGAVETGKRFYPAPWLRVGGPVEIWVSPETFTKALYALGKGEYRAFKPYREGDPWISLKRGSRATAVVLHRALQPRLSEEANARVFERSLENRIPGLPRHTRALTAHDHLMYLMSKNRDPRSLSCPMALNDLYFMIRGSELSSESAWGGVIEELRRLQLVAISWLTFQILESRGEPVVPASVQKALASKLGAYRRRGMVSFAALPAWHSDETRKLSWKLKSRFLLRDGAFSP